MAGRNIWQVETEAEGSLNMKFDFQDEHAARIRFSHEIGKALAPNVKGSVILWHYHEAAAFGVNLVARFESIGDDPSNYMG